MGSVAGTYTICASVRPRAQGSGRVVGRGRDRLKLVADLVQPASDGATKVRVHDTQRNEVSIGPNWSECVKSYPCLFESAFEFSDPALVLAAHICADLIYPSGPIRLRAAVGGAG